MTDTIIATGTAMQETEISDTEENATNSNQAKTQEKENLDFKGNPDREEPPVIKKSLKEEVAPLKVKASGTTISPDRTTGIGQIQTLIPDPVFAAAVYDAFAAAGHMGDRTSTILFLLLLLLSTCGAYGAFVCKRNSK